MNRIILGLKLLSRLSLFKTLWINFRCLTFLQAIKFPILVGRGTVLRNLSGSIDFKCKIKPALFTIGLEYIFNDSRNNSSIIDNRGKIVIHGKVLLHTGVVLHTRKKGQIIFKGLNKVGANTLIVSANKIIFGHNLQSSWNVQILDTDFHYVIEKDSNNIKKNTKPIEIGNNVWIGNNVSLKKGVVIPNNSIVGSHSVVSQFFALEDEYSLIIGAPAKIVKTGVSMLFDEKREIDLNNR